MFNGNFIPMCDHFNSQQSEQPYIVIQLEYKFLFYLSFFIFLLSVSQCNNLLKYRLNSSRFKFIRAR